MPDMIRGLTYTLRITVPVDLSNITACELWIGITLNNRLCHTLDELSITSEDNSSIISYTLTEEESINLLGEQIHIQCRWRNSDGTIAGTKRTAVKIESAIWNKEMART